MSEVFDLARLRVVYKQVKKLLSFAFIMHLALVNKKTNKPVHMNYYSVPSLCHLHPKSFFSPSSQDISVEDSDTLVESMLNVKEKS